MSKSKLNEKLNKLQRTLLVYEEAGKHYRTEWRHGRCYKIYTHDKVTIEAEKKRKLKPCYGQYLQYSLSHPLF